MRSIEDFTLAPSELRFVGQNLSRPESVIAEKDGTLWVSDNRGGATRIDPSGTQTLVGEMGGDPNGLAMDIAGDLYIANIGDGNVYKLRRDGAEEIVLSEINGQPLGSPNFVFIDSQDRLWISISSRVLPWFPAVSQPRPDGYIVLINDKGPHIVADGLWFVNEIRMDANEEYLYAAETMARRIVRYPVMENGLGECEVVPPGDLGFGAYVDGFTFDAEDNLWVTTIVRNGLVIITPDGDYHTVFEDVNAAALNQAVAKIEDNALTPEDMFACVGPRIQFPASVTFGGSDLKTVYLGSLAMPHLATFQSPVPGLPMRHWR